MSTDKIAEFLADARSIAAISRSAVRGKALWVTGVPKLHILAQSAVVRQLEALESAIVLAEVNRAYSALPFVRPACEEYLWLKYLALIDKSDAEEVIDHFARKQALEALRAQEVFAGEEQTRELGLAGVRTRFEDEVASRQSALRKLGERLKWAERTRRDSSLPSTRWVAKRVDELSTYEFIYGASSRHVHFNVAELMRRVWGRDGVFEIGLFRGICGRGFRDSFRVTAS